MKCDGTMEHAAWAEKILLVGSMYGAQVVGHRGVMGSLHAAGVSVPSAYMCMPEQSKN